MLLIRTVIQEKLLDSSKIKNHGWSPETTLDFGLNKSYEWFINNF